MEIFITQIILLVPAQHKNQNSSKISQGNETLGNDGPCWVDWNIISNSLNSIRARSYNCTLIVACKFDSQRLIKVLEEIQSILEWDWL